MSTDPQLAIQNIRMRRTRKAADELRAALDEGRAVSEELLQASGLLERGIDPREIRVTAADIERLLETTRQIEAQTDAPAPADQHKPLRRRPL